MYLKMFYLCLSLFSSISLFLLLQIKCVRYWPDYGVTLFADGREIKNVNETSTGDFIIREFEIDEDPVSPSSLTI